MAGKQATAAPQVHTAGAYRSNAAWHTAAQAANAASAGNPAYKAAAQVITHLGWRAPGGTVGWHKGTNANMVANAAAMGVQPGMAVQPAMALAVAALGKAATTPLQQQQAATLAAMVGK